MRRKQYNVLLLNILKDSINYENKIFILKSLILTPQSDHFNTVLLNYQNEIMNLKHKTNYYYKGDTKNHFLEEVDNINSIIKKNIIYLGIYVEAI